MRNLIAVLLMLVLVSTCFAASPTPLDRIDFGDQSSESQHKFSADHSQVVQGALDQPARQLTPMDSPTWFGGHVAFDMKVDPDQPNYVTVRFWGGDAGQDRGRLVLYIDGKQVGQRHLGEVDILDILNDKPRFPGRFFYKTLPLPVNMTRGKNSVQLKIEAIGHIWVYGDTWDRFQYPLEQNSRSLYSLYTHTDPFFTPPADQPQGNAPASDAKRPTPGPEVLEAVKERINSEIASQMRYNDEMRQVFIQFMANAYLTPWTDAYHKQEVLEKIVRGIDSRYRVYVENPDIIKSDRQTWNHDWFGFGPTADAVRLLAEELQPYLDQNITDTNIPRRKGWADMFIASRDWHITTRRQYTNQSMIKDTYGIYLCNRGVAVVDPDRAWPEKKAKRYLYESVGLEPWRGSDDENGTPTFPLGRNYMQLTEAGLTKELGYVGNYGEVIDWVVALYDATRPSHDAEGDPKIKEQLIKIAKARAAFRYPLPDVDGYRSMQLETVVGWRDHYYPGGVVYDQRASWDGLPLEAAAVTMDPALVGYGKHMLDDNQYFAVIKERMEDTGFRVTANLLKAPGDYEAIKNAPDTGSRLPMAADQPDFVFADPQIGVVAIKNGDEVFYASLYWRARYAINNLARIHYLTPTIERDATVLQHTKFVDSGMVYELPDMANEAQSKRHEKMLKQAGVHRAEAGEKQPIAKLPADVKGFKPGKENVYAGKGDFYQMQYGPYLIAMNCTKSRRYKLDIPNTFRGATDLATGREILSRSLLVQPWQTVVLYKPMDQPTQTR